MQRRKGRFKFFAHLFAVLYKQRDMIKFKVLWSMWAHSDEAFIHFFSKTLFLAIRSLDRSAAL